VRRTVCSDLVTNRMQDASGDARRLLIRKLACAAVCALLLSASVAFADKKKDDANVRTVQGSVTDTAGEAVNGAVVQLKNTKTLQIRSFITKDNGAYYFHGLSTDVDYELRADYLGASSGSKTLSTFDSRKVAVMNLKLDKK
jgi:Carboxypeptidase regulatory-like domain